MKNLSRSLLIFLGLSFGLTNVVLAQTTLGTPPKNPSRCVRVCTCLKPPNKNMTYNFSVSKGGCIAAQLKCTSECKKEKYCANDKFTCTRDVTADET